MNLRTLIVDDEPLARDRLRDALLATPGFEVAGECGDGVTAASFLREQECDLVLLDVQMPGLDGFEVVAEIGPTRMPPVVFVTAYDEYAVRAFEVSALDYLEKPWSLARLRLALDRARVAAARQDQDRLGERLEALLAAREGGPAPLIVRAGGRITLLEPGEILWVEAAANYVRLHCDDQEVLAREPLKAIADRLPPERFVRIHRSSVLNLDKLRKVEPDENGDLVVVLRDGTRLRCGRTYREGLLERLGQ